MDAERDKQQLEERQQALLEESQDGDSEAAEAREAVLDELESVEDDLEDLRGGNVCERYYDNLVGDNDEFYDWLYDGVVALADGFLVLRRPRDLWILAGYHPADTESER